MGNFFAELKRRHMYRVAAAYAVVAWVLLQIVNNVAPVLDLPPWVARAFLLALVIGFPIALLFVWMRDLAASDAASPKAATTKLDYVLAGGLAVVIALVSYQQLAPSSADGFVEPQATVLPQAGIAIAVLPFANLSGDASQEFFSDGMTEEITAALAKVPNLQVVGRTSAFQFKGQAKDFAAIRQALGVTYLIDGSVRKEGDRVRITAQLVQADNGANVWTESYDRQLTSVFATQEDIARAIATSLRVPLGLQQGEQLISNRSIDPESYQQYLRGKALVRARGFQPLTDATLLLEQVVTRNPNYAPAWATLALAYDLTPQSDPAWLQDSVNTLQRVVNATQPKAEAAAQKVVQLDPGLADGYSTLGLVNQRRSKLLIAEEMFSKALTLDPNDPALLQGYSNFLAGVGRLKEALAMKQHLDLLERYVPVYSSTHALVLWLNGQDDAAEAVMKTIGNPGFRAYALAQFYAAAGRFDEAAASLRDMPPGVYPPGLLDAVVRILRAAPTSVDTKEALPPLSDYAWVYLYVGMPDRVLDVVERNVEASYFQAINHAVFWHPAYAPVRKTERFKAYVRSAGLVEYWRAKGWPEFCHPTTGDDFECN